MPTLLVNGADVTGRQAGSDDSGRLDFPSEEQMLAALNATTRTSGDGRQGPDKA